MTGPAKILAVDDEADFELLIRQQFRRQIRAQEYDFSFAHHGEEALAAIEADPAIELMLLDINMPVMDGLTLLSVLQERQSPVRAVIVSAYGDMANIRTAMNRGAFDFVTKPVDLKDLDITIRKTLGDIARVRELALEHVEAQLARLRGVAGAGDELEACVRIDEPADQPGRGDAIDLHPPARDPDTPLERTGRAGPVWKLAQGRVLLLLVGDLEAAASSPRIRGSTDLS